MMITLPFKNKTFVTDKDIASFFKKRGYSLPLNYVNFLKNNYGGRFIPEKEIIINVKERCIPIENIFPFNHQKKFCHNPFQWIEDHDYVPEYLLPVAQGCDDQASRFYMVMNPVGSGEIIMVDGKSNIFKNFTIEKVMMDKGTSYISDDFYNFLALLNVIDL